MPSKMGALEFQGEGSEEGDSKTVIYTKTEVPVAGKPRPLRLYVSQVCPIKLRGVRQSKSYPFLGRDAFGED